VPGALPVFDFLYPHFSPSIATLRFDGEKECTRSPLARDAAARLASILAKE
jgi:hypothetical protein